MKKLFLTGMSLFFVATLAFAQEINPEEKAREKAAEMTERLLLTVEQQEPIQRLVLSGIHEKQAIKADGTLSDSEKKKRMKASQKDQHDKIKALLTQEQITQYEKWVKSEKHDKK